MAWTQGQICEGLLWGGEKIHGYTPDGTVLCGALGEGDTIAWDRGGPHGPSMDFTDQTEDGCKRCMASWRKLAP